MTEGEFIVRLRLVGVEPLVIERMLEHMRTIPDKAVLEEYRELWVKYSEEGIDLGSDNPIPGSAYVEALNRTWGSTWSRDD